MEIRIELPKPHSGQQKIIAEAKRFNALECGRRFGKSTLGENLLIEPALEGFPTAWFSPTNKFATPQWESVVDLVKPITKSIDRTERRIQLITGGQIDFWSLDHPDAGRGRKYKRAIIDEAALVRGFGKAWEESIRPTLTDLLGDAWFFFTPKGRNYAHQLYEKGQDTDNADWMSWRMGTIANPYISPDEIADAQRQLPEHVFNQEYLGIPADDGGNPFGIDAIRLCVQPLSTEPPAVFGVDLAKSQDFTWVIGLDRSGNVCVSERWQSDWRQTRERVLQLIGNYPALIDSTGVGDPIVEDMQRTNAVVESFKFTSQSKQQIMEGLASSIQQGQIGFPEGQLVSELESFGYEFTNFGVRYSAPAGLNDDGVCALALANHKLRAFVPFALGKGETRNAAEVGRRFAPSGSTQRRNTLSRF